MSVVKETLKVNDELSIDIDVIYRNGEKYADIHHCQSHMPETYNHQLNEISTNTYSPIHGYKDLIAHEYANSLSIDINQDMAFPELYEDEDTEPFTTWEMWNEQKCIQKIESKWEYRYPQEQINGDWYNFDSCMNIQNKDILFPFIITYGCEYAGPGGDAAYRHYIHFDCFIFLLYLKYPQYKNDLIRFLKYQPVCTKTSDELYIYNLKQTNKDLLKQLNEANDKVASAVETEAKLKATEDELQSKTNELNKLMGDMVAVNKEYHDLHEIHSTAITKLKEVTDSVDAKDKEIETLKTDIEAKDKIIEQLTEVVTTASNERDEWKSKYEKLKELLHSIE